MPKKVNREERRKLILDVFCQCLREKSYYETTIKDIAQRAGLSPSQMYCYFESKEAILMALCEENVKLLRGTLQDYVTQIDGMTMDTFMQLFAVLVLSDLSETHWGVSAAQVTLKMLAYSRDASSAVARVYSDDSSNVLKEYLPKELSETEKESTMQVLMALYDGIMLRSIVYNLDEAERLKLGKRILSSAMHLGKHESNE